MTIIDEIIDAEWRFFDKVQNEGGRAGCQDDFETFQIMRKSQFLAWDEATVQAYAEDLHTAQQLGRNLIQEKYARMMASTALAQYATFAHLLPALSAWQLQTIEAIIETQVVWREIFARDYPHMSGQARLIRTAEDTPYQTSFETYLRGELGTYSEKMLSTYQSMVKAYQQRGENLTTRTMDETARLYGYKGLEDAESRLRASA
jgi:hypothetical protein